MPKGNRGEKAGSLPEVPGLTFADYGAYADWMGDAMARMHTASRSGETGPDTPVGAIGLEIAIARSQNGDFTRYYDDALRVAREQPGVPLIGLM